MAGRALFFSSKCLQITGVMQRNLFFAAIATVVLRMNFYDSSKFLDFGGGYGILTRMMRDNGFDFYWHDKYANNLLAKGFEGDLTNSTFSAVTAFENLEHLVEPMTEIEKILEISDFLLFSTQLLPEKIPHMGNWWYYCLDHGQHVSFFSRTTLEFIASTKRLFLSSDNNNLHILSKRPIKNLSIKIAKFAYYFGLTTFFKLKSKVHEDMSHIIKARR